MLMIGYRIEEYYGKSSMFIFESPFATVREDSSRLLADEDTTENEEIKDSEET